MYPCIHVVLCCPLRRGLCNSLIVVCEDHMFLDFVDHPKMKPIKDRTVWIHVNIPGQGAGAADLPAELVLFGLQLTL